MISERIKDLMVKARTAEEFAELAYTHVPGNLADFVTLFEVAFESRREYHSKIAEACRCMDGGGDACCGDPISKKIRDSQ